MNCETAERLISKRLDGEASADESRRLDEHCSACPACRRYLATQAAIHGLLDTALSPLPQTVSAPRPGRRAAWRKAAAAGAVAALMFASGLVGHHLPRGGRETGPPVALRPTGDDPAAEVASPAEPNLTVGRAEGETARLAWDGPGGHGTASRIDQDTTYRVASPEGHVEIRWLERDTTYRLVGFE
ncbi:MAG: zf-HC2 domain-containing protein [Planctomycetota bacterium]